MQRPLPLIDYRRYGRQMILDGIGLPGQLKLRQSSVAVIGAGGLGCPALQYLVAAGVGTIGIVDHDEVEISNLQRQVLHSEAKIGMNKAVSAAESLRRINSNVELVAHECAITSANAVGLLRPFDVVLDCTDNAPTRYLLSDTCVALQKALVSGAAQKFEGQMCVYNLGKDGPCYRCLFPKPPAPDVVGSCAELGILGAVTGVIGTLQALEAIKLILGLQEEKPVLTIFSALSPSPYRTIKLRPRRPTCPACGTADKKLHSIADTDYIAFCGGQRPDWEKLGLLDGPVDHRVKPKALNNIMQTQREALLIIDVRSPTEYGICHIPGTLNIPLPEIVANPRDVPVDGKEVYLVCRLGNDSQIAADALRSAHDNLVVQDLVGGLRAWTNDVDPNFPIY